MFMRQSTVFDGKFSLVFYLRVSIDLLGGAYGRQESSYYQPFAGPVRRVALDRPSIQRIHSAEGEVVPSLIVDKSGKPFITVSVRS